MTTQIVYGQKRHVRRMEQTVLASLVEPAIVSHGKRKRLSPCQFFRSLQQRGTNSLPPCGRSNAKIDDPENGHDDLANAHDPEFHPHM